MISNDQFTKLLELNKQTLFTKNDLQFIWDCCAEEKAIGPLTLVAMIDRNPLTEELVRKGQEIAKKYGLLNDFAGLPYDKQEFAGKPE